VGGSSGWGVGTKQCWAQNGVATEVVIRLLRHAKGVGDIEAVEAADGPLPRALLRGSDKGYDVIGSLRLAPSCSRFFVLFVWRSSSSKLDPRWSAVTGNLRRFGVRRAIARRKGGARPRADEGGVSVHLACHAVRRKTWAPRPAEMRACVAKGSGSPHRARSGHGGIWCARTRFSRRGVKVASRAQAALKNNTRLVVSECRWRQNISRRSWKWTAGEKKARAFPSLSIELPGTATD